MYLLYYLDVVGNYCLTSFCCSFSLSHFCSTRKLLSALTHNTNKKTKQKWQNNEKETKKKETKFSSETLVLNGFPGHDFIIKTM